MGIGIYDGGVNAWGATDFVERWQASKDPWDPRLEQPRVHSSPPEQQLEVDMIEFHRQITLDRLLARTTRSIEANVAKTLMVIARNIR